MRGLSYLLTIMLTYCTACGKQPAETEMPQQKAISALSAEEVKEIAEEGFIYGLPIVMNYGVIYDFAIDEHSGQFKAPFNQLYNEARVFTYKDTSVVTPNSDTPYSMLTMDLRAEPLVLSVPTIEKTRYFSVQLCDGNTFNYGYIGSRTTGNGGGDFMVVGPGWKGNKPDGIKQVFESSTWFSAAIYRTQLFGPDDMANVTKIQAAYKVQPLSSYLKQPSPPSAPPITFLRPDKTQMKLNFFRYLSFALQFAPAGPEEEKIRSLLERLGVSDGKAFDFNKLSPDHQVALLEGMKGGETKIQQYLDEELKDINGWKIGELFGDRSFFHGNWLKRAAGAAAGIYGNDAAEAVYPMTKTTSNGELLDGSKHTYTLTFPADQLPPVNAFWSVTMYDGKTQLLVQNPINRYLINSTMLPGLKKNRDGSITLYIQRQSPGSDKESNWLPAANGPLYLVMRLYWPKESPPSILPAGEGTWQPPPLILGD